MRLVIIHTNYSDIHIFILIKKEKNCYYGVSSLKRYSTRADHLQLQLSHSHTLTLLQSSYLALRNQIHPTKTLFSPSKNT